MVSGLTVEAGEVALPGTPNLPGAPLMTVTDMANLRVRALVDETDVLIVQGGQDAFVYPQAAQADQRRQNELRPRFRVRE